MDARVKAVLAELHAHLERLYGDRLVRMVLYGSQARGDAEAGSDIDVLVVLKGDVSPCQEIARTSEDVAQVSLDHDVVVVCTFVSEDQFRHERSPLLLNVRREGVFV
jgi:predicted nucleotidyltransferase